MSKRAKAGTCLGTLTRMAVPLCQAAQRQCPRTGPGRPPEFEDWQMAALIMVAVLHKRKSKSSQFHFLEQHQERLVGLLKLRRFPGRSTYFERYRSAHRLFQAAIALQGRKALAEHVADAKLAAADKSLIAARGKPWHRCRQKRNQLPRGVDPQASWGYSTHHGWVFGYCYEVLICATKGKLCFPLLASADQASRSEHRSFPEKIQQLPRSLRQLLLDGGYDSNPMAEAVEYRADGKPTGRRYVCPLQSRGGKPAVGQTLQRGKRERSRQRRALRQRFFTSKYGQRIYQQRMKTCEPFNHWFKQLFELDQRTWHRGLDNNRTQILAAIFCYQLLLRYNHRLGHRDAQVQWILDGL